MLTKAKLKRPNVARSRSFVEHRPKMMIIILIGHEHTLKTVGGAVSLAAVGKERILRGEEDGSTLKIH
jgi:hypothetical protein